MRIFLYISQFTLKVINRHKKWASLNSKPKETFKREVSDPNTFFLFCCKCMLILKRNAQTLLPYSSVCPACFLWARKNIFMTMLGELGVLKAFFPRDSRNTWVLEQLGHYLPVIRPRESDLTSLSFDFSFMSNSKGNQLLLCINYVMSKAFCHLCS